MAKRSSKWVMMWPCSAGKTKQAFEAEGASETLSILRFIVPFIQQGTHTNCTNSQSWYKLSASLTHEDISDQMPARTADLNPGPEPRPHHSVRA